MPSVTQERRRFPRSAPGARLSVNLVHPYARSVSHVNYSEGGLCLRLDEALEVRSLIRFQVAPVRSGEGPRSSRSIECTGRVAWVIQRLDLRSMPPFLFDVGVEFVDPPPLMRRLIAQRATPAPAQARGAPARALEAVVIRGRQFVPRLEREADHPTRWHLVVFVDGAPCFSSRYPSERAALSAWSQFQRQQAKR